MKICFRVDENFAYIDVYDSGPGVPENIIPRLFEEGFTTKKHSPLSGNGFGLNIARQVVASLGGELTYVTASPHTLFRITLPRHKKTIAAPEAA
jgi:signal transduction histidine kinase